ncbi:hypothetical protein PHLGIDRAFT_122544 [Phlebiopsis gigantea 11061_1 CR5-6]|uniref:Uncharacterized protein n=1 Tax=Phlebiopsis gigantea (strain 11061_1 CR5-6) TaxID=745531 RepID=A0A0C3RQZ4_PHLG1|nr:hypothetical protein PHLGIDRAFT_122544 [Phlebiopsis gigantea 11061_1 CR5-6]
MPSSDKRPSEDPLVKRPGRISSSSVNTPAPATAVPPTPLMPDMTRSQNIGDLRRTTAALAGSLPPVSPSVQTPSSTPQPPREPPSYTAQAMSASHCAEISKPHFPFSSAPTSSFGPTSELPSHMAQPVRADYSAESFNWDFSSDSCSGPIDTPASYFSPGPPAGATTAPVYDGSPMEAVRSKFPMRVTEISSSFLTALNNVPYNGIPGVLAGSSMIPFSSSREEDPVNISGMLHYENISCMPAYQSAHADELRVQDYQQGRRPAVMPPRNAEPAPLDTYLTPLPPARGGQGPPANRAPATAIASAATFQYRDESLDPSPGRKKRTAHRKNRHR